MNHQPYEDWLLSEPTHLEEQLTSIEYSELQTHLQECSSCRLLSFALMQADDELRAAPMLSPEPGFTHRWLEKLEINRAQAHKNQTIFVLLAAVVAALILLGSFTYTMWPWISNPNVILWKYLYHFTKRYSYFNVFQNIVGVLLNTTTSLIPMSWWIFMTGLICELGVLWIVFYRLISTPRRITQ